jgi:hypothetical protein
MEAGVRKATWLAMLLAVAVIAVVALKYPLSMREAGDVFRSPLFEDVAVLGVTATLTAVGIVFAVFSRSALWPERLALFCVVGTLCFVAFVLVDKELVFAELFPRDGADLGWKPGEARAEFMSSWYWTAAMHLTAGVLGAAALLLVSKIRRFAGRS